MTGDDDLEADLARLVGETRAIDAVQARIRERNLREAAAAEATLAGLLLDMAEAEASVSIRTAFGRTVHGRVELVATDVVVLASPSGPPSYVRLDAIAWIRRVGPSGRREPTGDRPAPRATTFAALVGALAGERPRVALAVFGEQTLLSGELRAAGSDVITVRLDGEPPATTSIALDQVSELTVLASG